MKNYLLSEEIIFDSKPEAVPYNYRISYKLAQLCLIMAMSCGRGGCSLVKLHMVSVGISTSVERCRLKEFANNRLSDYFTIIRFDPAVNRAVKYAVADKLIYQQQNGFFRLTDKGKKFVSNIQSYDDLLVSEKSFLAELSNKLTEDKIKTLMDTWRYSNAES